MFKLASLPDFGEFYQDSEAERAGLRGAFMR
jgi:hypothetical protein